MKQINYANMSDQELKQYLLEHKDNKDAFYAYVDRKQQHPKQVIIGVNELETLTTEEKIDLLTQRLQARFNV
ncbi:MAG: hypothetical protein AB4058_05610 [Microcystaceae cyanobacterium]